MTRSLAHHPPALPDLLGRRKRRPRRARRDLGPGAGRAAARRADHRPAARRGGEPRSARRLHEPRPADARPYPRAAHRLHRARLQDDAQARRELGQSDADQVALQASPERDLARRHALHRGGRQVHLREGQGPDLGQEPIPGARAEDRHPRSAHHPDRARRRLRAAPRKLGLSVHRAEEGLRSRGHRRVRQEAGGHRPVPHGRLAEAAAARPRGL